MASTQGHISIDFPNLTGSSYSFQIYIRNCGSGSWGSVIDTIPYSGFPYYFNINQVLSGSPTCFEYLVIEPTTQTQCTGSIVFISPTPTPTPTITPTTSPLPLNLYLSQEFESGSTVATYTLSSSKSIGETVYYQFQNTLRTTGGTEFTIYQILSIQGGSTTGSTRTTLPFKSFAEIDPTYTKISDFQSNGPEFSVDRYASVVFQNNTPPTKKYIFKHCCDTLPQLNALIPWDAAQVGGWATLGGVVQVNGQCYFAFAPGGTGTGGYFGTYDTISCLSAPCPSCPQNSPTPTRTATRTPTITPTRTVTKTPTTTPSITPSCGVYCGSQFIDCSDVDLDCFVSPCLTPPPQSPTPTPTVTPTTSPVPGCFDSDIDGWIYDWPE